MTAHKKPSIQNLKAKAVEELKRYAVITAYLWVLFFLLSMYRRLLLKENGIDPWTHTYTIINALVFAKVVLLGEAIDLGGRLRKQALILVVIGRAVLFTALLMVFHFVEEAIGALIKGQSVADSVLHLGGGSWFGVWVYAGLLCMMMLPLCAFREIGYVLGSDVLWSILIGRENAG